MLSDHWPLSRLRVRIDGLELRLPNEAELAALADVAAAGIDPPGIRTYLNPWTDLPPEQRARTVIQRHWRRCGAWTPQDWSLELAVFADGRPVGVQDMSAEGFAHLREVQTGSWLGLEYQGKGIGRRIRSAALHLAFAGLGATDATTMSFTENPAPLRVSEKLGYQPDGITRDLLHDEVMVSQRLRLTRAGWEETERPEVAITGLEACLADFGAA